MTLFALFLPYLALFLEVFGQISLGVDSGDGIKRKWRIISAMAASYDPFEVSGIAKPLFCIRDGAE